MWKNQTLESKGESRVVTQAELYLTAKMTQHGRGKLIRVVVQSLSHIQLFATPWTATHQASLFFIISQSLLKFMFIESVLPSNHLILCCPLLLLPSIFPSIRVFSNESLFHIRGQSIGVSNEYSGLISFRIDCFDLLAVQGILDSLLQHHSWKTSMFQCAAFFMV